MAAVLELADPACTDPSVAGAKAARLATASSAGLPVLPGVVVPAARSRRPLGAGLALIDAEGSHAAQLAVMEADTSDLADLPTRVNGHGDAVVVRSSSVQEGAGCWSGAFTSYLDVPPAHLLTAVRGVWASALGRDALDRGHHTGTDATAPGIAVLVQPQLRPDFAGTATIEPDGTVTVVAVAGSPVPLLHGWEPGWLCRRAADQTVTGDLGALDDDLVHAVADLVARVAAELGDDRVEWAAVGDRLHLLQSTTTRVRHDTTADRTARTDLPSDAVDTARELLDRAADPGERLRAEPFTYEAVMTHGDRVTGVPAAPGIGAGPVTFIEGIPSAGPPPRAVLVAPRPLPHLAPLLWGASGLVTFGGSPAAHLVEVARSLNLPAVVGCGRAGPLLRATDGDGIAAVDGDKGVVSTHVPAARS